MHFYYVLVVFALVTSIFILIILLKKAARETFLELMPKLADFWFDKLKWLFLIGAITFVAESNNNVALRIIAGLSYVIPYLYMVSKIIPLIYDSAISGYIYSLVVTILSTFFLYFSISDSSLKKNGIIYKMISDNKEIILSFLLKMITLVASLILILITFYFYCYMNSLVLQLQKNSTSFH